MKRFIPRRPSPAMIVALIALIAALGGTAVAGGFLKTKKFKTFKANVNKELSQTVHGPVTYVPNTVQVPGLGSNFPVTATCPAGTHPIGGGIKPSSGALEVNDSYPTTSGWAGHVFNGGGMAPVFVVAICATTKTNGSPPDS